MKSNQLSIHQGPALTLGTTLTTPQHNIVLRGSDLAAHKHVQGISGAGKSKFLTSMFLQLLNQGIPCAVIDPHADLVREILAFLLETGFYQDKRAFQRVWYVDFSRVTEKQAIPFNILNLPLPEHQIASLIVEVCKRAWSGGTSHTPNLENILLASTLVLVQNKLPLGNLPKLLHDATYREQLLRQVTDTAAKDFFTDRFAGYGKQAGMLSESTLRRVFLLTFSPTLRYTLGQIENVLDFRAIMDHGISCLFNLGNLDPQTQRFLGCLLSVGFETAALSRADTSIYDAQRRPYHLIIDEFSQFCAQSEEALERVLALCRKFGLTLTLAHQTWSQVNHSLQGALQNCIHVLFKLGYDDANWAAPRFMEHDPYRVKHEVPHLPWEAPRSHPLYFSESETQAMWKQKFASLERQEAIVRIGQATHLIKTLDVPQPAVNPKQLTQLEDMYTRLLFKPVSNPQIPPTPPASQTQPAPSTKKPSSKPSSPPPMKPRNKIL